ncbi:hypothetical protein ACFL5U_02390 [Candidatus Margulisiibacteriota bacterium]
MKLNYLEGISSALVVGLGQILKGNSKKGLALLLTFYLALPSTVYLSLVISGKYFLTIFALVIISGIILWLYSIVDALRKT